MNPLLHLGGVGRIFPGRRRHSCGILVPKEITMSLGMKQVFFRKCSVSVWFICSVHFLFRTSRASGTGIIVKRALTSKDTKVYLELPFVLSEFQLILWCF